MFSIITQEGFLDKIFGDKGPKVPPILAKKWTSDTIKKTYGDEKQIVSEIFKLIPDEGFDKLKEIEIAYLPNEILNKNNVIIKSMAAKYISFRKTLVSNKTYTDAFPEKLYPLKMGINLPVFKEFEKGIKALGFNSKDHKWYSFFDSQFKSVSLGSVINSKADLIKYAEIVFNISDQLEKTFDWYHETLSEQHWTPSVPEYDDEGETDQEKHEVEMARINEERSNELATYCEIFSCFGYALREELLKSMVNVFTTMFPQYK